MDSFEFNLHLSLRISMVNLLRNATLSIYGSWLPQSKQLPPTTIPRFLILIISDDAFREDQVMVHAR